jgi:hypothetical protein
MCPVHAHLQVPGAEVTVYRVQDPVKGDDHSLYDEGVLDAPIATTKVPKTMHAASCCMQPFSSAPPDPAAEPGCLSAMGLRVQQCSRAPRDPAAEPGCLSAGDCACACRW